MHDRFQRHLLALDRVDCKCRRTHGCIKIARSVLWELQQAVFFMRLFDRHHISDIYDFFVLTDPVKCRISVADIVHGRSFSLSQEPAAPYRLSCQGTDYLSAF